MLEALGYLVALDRKAVVAAVGELLDYATLIAFHHLHWLLAVVHAAHSLRVELSLEGRLLLLDHFVGQLDFFVVGAVDAVPHETVYVFGAAFDIAVDFLHRFLAFDALLVASVDQRGQLVKLGSS